MVAVTRRFPRRAWAVALAGAMLVLTAQGAMAGSSGPAANPQVDALWNAPQGTRVDSAFYVVQSWWDGLTRVAERDARKRGLQELAQANEDLLTAYTLLQEQRTDPGPHPVAVIDPFLSGTYAFVTGVQVKAPLGSLLGWLNEGALHLEGRGSTDTIIKELMRDYQKQNSLANRDLASPGDTALAGIITANTPRQTAMIARIVDVTSPSSDLRAMLTPASTPAIAAGPRKSPAAARTAASSGKIGGSLGKGDDSHGRTDDSHGKGDDARSKPAGHLPDKR